MKFSYNWISELIDGLDLLPGELCNWITIKTAESEGVETYASYLSQVCAAAVIGMEPIEGSKNVKAIVQTGRCGLKTVVCGAPNCRVGMVTAYVAPGTNLRGREIRQAVIAGVESEGMLASGEELGINRDNTGILDLHDLEPGAPLGLIPDSIIEVDNKSLTHRPDLWGHHGMAREVAAILGKRLLDPAQLQLPPDGPAPIAVAIEKEDLCPRYSALVFDNVTVQPSPLWLQYRLQAVGLNPINNIVDVTNYVMAEIAQPMHAFDADKLQGSIAVRSGRKGEQIQALNGETYSLGPANLLITDDGGPIAIAGVIGGAQSAISSGTRRIVVESANFHPGSVRRTSSALKLRTDASMRFEKSQDPVNTLRGLARAVELLQVVSPGIVIVGGVTDVGQAAKTPEPIELPLDWLDRKLGRHVSLDEVQGIFESLGFGVSVNSPGTLLITVPSWRATKDISLKEDLVEEIGRMVGYGSIPPNAPKLAATVPPPNELRAWQTKLRQVISARGFHEVYNYSFLSDETVERFGLDPKAQVRVLNPIAAGQDLMRSTLVPGIWKNVVENSRFLEHFRLFELGVEAHKREGALPAEIHHIAAAVYSKDGNEQPLFELKGLAEAIIPRAEIRLGDALRPFEHPARVAQVYLHNRAVGRLFELHPSFVEKGRAAVLDIDLDELMRLSRDERRYLPIRRFPSSAFDLSVIAGVRAVVGQIQRDLTVLSGEQLESIEFVRQYSGPPLPEGQKSVSFRVTVAASDRTLSSDEVSSIRARMIDGMRTLGYDLRV